MMPLVFYTALLLGIGWVIAHKRKGWRARSVIMASVPAGAFVGGYSGGGICSLVLHLYRRGESHNDLFPFAAASIFGMLVGGVALPVVALFFTKPKRDDDTVGAMSMSSKQKDKSWGWYIALLIIGCVVGLVSGAVLVMFILEPIFHPSSRDCPHGWSGLFAAASLFTFGALETKYKSKELGMFFIGVALGMGAFSRFTLWWYTNGPSC